MDKTTTMGFKRMRAQWALSARARTLKARARKQEGHMRVRQQPTHAQKKPYSKNDGAIVDGGSSKIERVSWTWTDSTWLGGLRQGRSLKIIYIYIYMGPYIYIYINITYNLPPTPHGIVWGCCPTFPNVFRRFCNPLQPTRTSFLSPRAALTEIWPENYTRRYTQAISFEHRSIPVSISRLVKPLLVTFSYAPRL